ncbi:thiamine pyrophosphate-binding protein [Jiangella mangrovi]|uniref:Thiamine pyrophosphate-dependent acetolactate synthase large subunit-like protein n=1 Tax=Jiangella mangrovi TaxID=1524084 RepID=A0A7W9LN62_9ACTN|nr:thiamine pyrophosphate-binding protein [Jiangella mangrovi]MBB5789971.1 thiamine pyrophosphate-dependent acetolactate synthase large subunit-like protein [Jiangella mangrovi]
MLVGEAAGRALAELGVRQAFGVVGSGNFHVTNALVSGGARFVAARHEGGAVTMADAYARMSGEVAAVTLHQGCGLTNALTGITEAAKSRTPLLVLAAEATVPGSNFFVDQPGLASAVGASSVRVSSASTALDDVARAYALARDERRTVVVNLPLDVQGLLIDDGVSLRPVGPAAAPVPPPVPVPDVGELAALLAGAERPVLIAGRGARHARAELLALADACGALVATSAVAKGLFHGSPWSLDVSGGFASPLAASLISSADVIVGFGCVLNMWTMRHGRLIGPSARVAQVDLDPDAVGRNRPVDLGVVGDSAAVAAAVTTALGELTPSGPGYRGEEVRERIARELRWRDVPHDDWGGDGRVDPRSLTIALDDLLPAERVVAVDSGNFMGYPSMYLSVPDEFGFCFTQAFQSIGLGLATAIGAALARPDRLPVAALGDGGALMAAAELDTVRRLGLPMVVVVYNDDAYGAEVHHFGSSAPLETVTFPPTDIAAVGAGYGFDGVTVRSIGDLVAVREWLDGPRGRPLLIDAKVAAPQGSWWLEEAFRGH